MLRFEADLAPTKPSLDVVVVSTLADLPEFSPPPAKPFFGDVVVTRSSGASQTLSALEFGWRPRTDAGRMGTMNAAAFVPDPDRPWKVPPSFHNDFFNGARQTGLTPLDAGDAIRFRELDAGLTPTGFEFNLTIPAAVTLTIAADGAALDPQPDIDLVADTVVFDTIAGEAFVTWRGSWLWEDAFEVAVLEVN